MKSLSILALLLGALCVTGLARAETGATAPKATVAAAQTDFCRAFASHAREARHARQKQQLAELKSSIETQIALLSAKTEELKQWVERRERIKATVTDHLVKLYANIEAETAAAQLQKLDVEMVAALLQQLNAKSAGEIMSAMEPSFASKLTQMMLVTSFNANKEKQPQ